MKYRRFGKTNIKMPVFSFGGMRFQQSWEDKTFDEIEYKNQKNLELIVNRALKLGINHIETARGYGTSEIQLGKILPNIKRNSITVQTKVAPFNEFGKFTKKFEESLKNLQLDYVDLLSIHGINDYETYNWVMKENGVLDEALQIQSKGLCKYIGFSTHGPSEVILKAVESGAFDYVNLHWYYIFQKHWHVVESAQKRDMGVFIISPNDKGGKLYSPTQKLIDICKPLSPMIFNDMFCLSKKQIHTLSIGASKPSDFDEHIKVLEYYESIDTIVEPIVKKLDKEFEIVKNRLGFDYFDEDIIPSYDKIPGNMNLQVILWLWNLVKSFDMAEYGRARYNLLGNGGHWFPGEKVQMEKLKI